MSTTPPNTPPFPPPPPPPPPFDPRFQYRAYREQQKAAWRAQKQQWKVQANTWKYQYKAVPRVPSFVGPILLITIGVIALLITMGHVNAAAFWSWYSQWWPIVLIAAGLGLILEWAIDMRSEKAPVRKGGFVGLVILLAFLGLAATGWVHFAGDFDDAFDAITSNFDQADHQSDVNVTNTQLAPNSTVQVDVPAGDISVSASEGNAFTLVAHTVISGGTDEQAQKRFKDLVPHVTVSGTSVQVRGDEVRRGRVDLTMTVPKNTRLILNSNHGDVTVADTTGGLSATLKHGDLRLNDLVGMIDVHAASKGEFSAHQINGDITGTGDCNELTLTEVRGNVKLNCSSVDQIHFEQILGSVHIDSRNSEVTASSLPGDLTLNNDELNITEATGELKVRTRSRNVELNEIRANTQVQNSDGDISVEFAGNYDLNASNEKGGVTVTLLPNAAAMVDGSAHNGEVESEFGLPVTGEETKIIKGSFGSGKQSKITLLARNGDLRIKRGSSIPVPPTTPHVAPVPPAAPSGALHLKAPTGVAPKPVTQ